jgi:hypothetical protein
MDTAEKFLSDARRVYSIVPNERLSIILREKYIQQRHDASDFNSHACMSYELWNNFFHRMSFRSLRKNNDGLCQSSDVLVCPRVE